MEEIKVQLRRLSNVLNSLLAIAGDTSTERVSEKWYNKKCEEINTVQHSWTAIATNDGWTETLSDASSHAQKLAELFWRNRSLVGVPCHRWESDDHKSLFDKVKFCRDDLKHLESETDPAKTELARIRKYQRAETVCDVDYEIGDANWRDARSFEIEPAVATAAEIPPVLMSNDVMDILLDGIESLSSPPKHVAGPEPASDRNEGPAVVLQGELKPVIVNGIEKAAVTQARYKVLSALVKSFPKRLTKGKLESKTGCGDAVKTFKSIRKIDDDWLKALLIPEGVYGAGYGIATAR